MKVKRKPYMSVDSLMSMYKLSLLFCCLVLELVTTNDALDGSQKLGDSIISERKRRAIETVTIETVVILDADYISYLRAKGHTTNESLYDLVALKWMGVQAEWGRVGVFGYDVRIAIKDIVLWETNPTWFEPSNDLGTTLFRLCSGTKTRGLWENYDHIFLFTGKKDANGYSGKANTGEICLDGGKCAVSAITSVVEYVITAHELGHSMGMGHDGDVGCPSPNDGIMGSRSLGWSTCSAAAARLLLSKSTASCLYTENVQAENKINITEAWPGMVYSNDEVCEFKHGPGYRYKANNQNPCPSYLCVNINETSSFYGVSFSYSTPTDGSYCGQEMVCVSRKIDGSYCISWNDTGLTRSLFKRVEGNWSSWTAMTSCSRTCGTGIRYRQRTCNNPKPQNQVWCEGNELDVELCNTGICVNDSLVESELIIQRASETCSFWKFNNVYEAIEEDRANYLDTGTKYNNNNNGQCEIKCDRAGNYTGGRNKRNGIMPGGTPCSPSQLSSFVETNNLPRRSGMFGKCVQGYCYLFGCDNKTGSTLQTRDVCGVCGGNNSTCTVVEGVYDTIVMKGERGIIDIVPANASLIQFYFTYGSMKSHFLELRHPDTDKGMITFTTFDTMKDPVKFAGTEWYLLWHKQYLYAKGPLTHDVVVKLFNYGKFNNTGVNYAYSLLLPFEDTTSSKVQSTMSSTLSTILTTLSSKPSTVSSTKSNISTKASSTKSSISTTMSSTTPTVLTTVFSRKSTKSTTPTRTVSSTSSSISTTESTKSNKSTTMSSTIPKVSTTELSTTSAVTNTANSTVSKVSTRMSSTTFTIPLTSQPTPKNISLSTSIPFSSSTMSNITSSQRMDTSDSAANSSDAIIIGVVGACVAFVLVVLAIVMLVMRNRRNSSHNFDWAWK